MAKVHHSTVRLPQQAYDRLRQLAEQTGLSAADHIRRAIDEYLDRKAKLVAQLANATSPKGTQE